MSDCTKDQVVKWSTVKKLLHEAWDDGYWTGGNDVGSGLRENELTPNPYREGK